MKYVENAKAQSIRKVSLFDELESVVSEHILTFIPLLQLLNKNKL